VSIGYQLNLKAAKAALGAKHGPTPSGQWMKAFKDAYPKPDGKSPVGVADASWVDSSGNARFPAVLSDGKPCFDRTVCDLDEDWCWLVAVRDGE